MIKVPHANADSHRSRYNLQPLVNLGPLALLPDPALGISKVCLQELGTGWANVFQEVVARKSSDLFASVAAAGDCYDLFPPGAPPVYAVLRFDFAGQAEPGLAEIWPPHTLVLTPASAAESIRRWLATRGFALHP